MVMKWTRVDGEFSETSSWQTLDVFYGGLNLKWDTYEMAAKAKAPLAEHFESSRNQEKNGFSSIGCRFDFL